MVKGIGVDFGTTNSAIAVAGDEAAGFENVTFEYEPVAAAYKYRMTLGREELLLIADFGGGTSDFCLVRLRPWRPGENSDAGDILGTDGVGVAGDTFDSRIVRNAAAPKLGLNSRYQPAFGKSLRVPLWIFQHLERWHYLSFLKTRKNLQLLRKLRAQALEPEKIEALIHIVRDDLGYDLYRAVESAKVELSEREASRVVFSDSPVDIDEPIGKSQFEAWIKRELEDITECVDRLLDRCGVTADQLNAVFLTGGSSFVAAIRGIFTRKFATARVRSGDELTSVAHGLAIRALE